MTYKQLIAMLQELTKEQLSCDVTVELGLTDECYPAEFMIAGSDYDLLDVGHPVIYVRDA